MIGRKEIITGLVIYAIGLFVGYIIGIAEKASYLDGNNTKKYHNRGKRLYFLAFLIMETYIVFIKPYAGMAGLNETIFNAATEFGGSIFSLNGLYTDEAEPLFRLWCYLIHLITPNYKVFIVVTCSIIYISFLGYTSSFLHSGSNTVFLVLITPFIMDWCFGPRTGLAIAYCLNAMVGFKDRKYIKFALFSVMATFTHFLSFGFILYMVAFIAIKNIERRKIYSFRTLGLLFIGMLIFSQISNNIYMSFRVSYRAAEQFSLRDYISYMPYIIITFLLLRVKEKRRFSSGDDMCIFAIFFNTVMIPITVQWGIYRLPYLFIAPIAIELANIYCSNNYRKLNFDLNGLIAIVIVMVYAFVKILTMGVQNYALYPEWIF